MEKKREINKKYAKTLSDGTECEFVFAISINGTEWKPDEVLHLFAELSKSAYIQIGNKMVYGTDNQKKITKLVVNGHNQLAD